MLDAQAVRAVLTDTSRSACEDLARRAARLTRQHFGRAVSLYAPLYLANYCENHCVYCGYHNRRDISRLKLGQGEMRREMEALAATGIRSVLLLTGESRYFTPPEYLVEAVREARRFFPSVSLEVYPLETEEYRELVKAGADGVTLYQETFDRERYAAVHLAGRKRDYDWRFEAPHRMARAGVRFLSLGVLLGLWDAAADVAALFAYVHDMERRYPSVEYSLSFPRIIPYADTPEIYPVPDVDLIKILALARLEFPRAGISLSTRETAALRGHALEIAVNRISAASRTTVGGYAAEQHPAGAEGTGDPGQFEVQDARDVADVVASLKQAGFDPVFTDWRHF